MTYTEGTTVWSVSKVFVNGKPIYTLWKNSAWVGNYRSAREAQEARG